MSRYAIVEVTSADVKNIVVWGGAIDGLKMQRGRFLVAAPDGVSRRDVLVDGVFVTPSVPSVGGAV